MNPSTFTILYVDDAAASARYYERVLDRPPLEASPNFAMFELAPGAMLGLWARADAQPAPEVAGGGAEIAFPVADASTVDARHADWKRKGVAIVQPPRQMDFGYTFAASDPDGHRLRVFAPSPGQTP